MRNYRIDFTHNTIVVDYKFDKAAQVIGSAAYDDLRRITADFPSMTVRVASHREQKSPHYTKRLNYKNMIRYMMTFENRDELLAEFRTIQEQSHNAPCPYAYVRTWFMTTFPNYNQPVCRVKPKPSFKSINEETVNSSKSMHSNANNLDTFDKEISQNF